MTRYQLSTTVSPLTRRQADELMELGYSVRDILTLGIDRIYREETSMVTRQFWAHKASGEVWAVQLRDGVVTGSCGPLHHSERSDLDALEYDPEGNEWFAEHDGEFALWQPQQLLGTDAKTAAREALENVERWGNAALVRYDDGSYDSVPLAYLSDVTWSGYGCVAVSCHINDLSEITGDGCNWDTLDADERAWAVEQLVAELDD